MALAQCKTLPKYGGMVMTIQAVFFDMGGTIETYRYTQELRIQATPGIQQRLISAGIDLGLSNMQLYETVSIGLKRYHQWSVQCLDELSPEQVWRDYILPDYSINKAALDVIAEELMMYIELHYYEREMRPEIPSVLEAIHRMGLKIGLISNVCSRGQVGASLEQYGIENYFDPIVLSSEYGRRKPDPAIFHYAARLANVPTSECLYVGDRIARDILGARKAGYRLAIQIRHDFDHGEVEEGATPDAIIDQMTELIDILKTELDQLTCATPFTDGSFRPIRALLFDAGDILYFRPQRGRRLKCYLKELSLDHAALITTEQKALELQAYQGEIDQEQYREGILRLYGVTQPEQIERGKQILQDEDNDIHFFAGVRKTLLALKNMGYLLGIVTDTANPVHVKLSWFERGGFGTLWDSIVSSRELGVRKPDPQIYQAALKQLGVSADQTVFVGHKASELEGARAVGIKTIAFNYEQSAQADYYVAKFAEILKVPIIT